MAQNPFAESAEDLVLEAPGIDDGADLWRLTRDAGSLDLNSAYHYLLWCRDFAATSVVARHDGRICGFVTGYVRPDVPDTLMVWQVAVAPDARKRGLAARMIDELLQRRGRFGQKYVEATVTPGNTASMALFRGFGRDRGAPVRECDLFAAAQFPGGGHEPEVLFRIGPVDPIGG
ncbi:MAG: diaminobutyrate acetyltransferase [Streptomycetaceae bacterium]|jgi:L-2,4-diaminobutyric acid acetyltransferase|nr:diaminobutyrate acetyltransferase [Streptomycetaceae bacterium]